MKKFYLLLLTAIMCCVNGASAAVDNDYLPTAVTPADGSTVASLYEFRLTYASTIGNYDRNPVVSLFADGDDTSPVATGTVSLDPYSTDVIVTLGEVVTTPGQYTLVIPEETIYKDWGGSEWAPELCYTYTVEGGAAAEGTTVVSVDPAPCAEGTYVDEMPSTVTVTMSDENFTIDDYGVRLQYGDIGLSTVISDYTVDGNTITINIPEKYLSYTEFMIIIMARSADGTPITYNNDTQIVLAYEMSSQATVESVDPAPYDGETYNEEIPSTITVTMTNENFTVTQDGVTAVGDDGLPFILPDYTVDGRRLNITVDDGVRGNANLTVRISATSANGEPIVYNDENGEQIILPYAIALNSFVPVAAEPEDGSTVESLSVVTLTFGSMVSTYEEDAEVVLQDESGATVTTGAISYGVAFEDAVVTLAEEVTKGGTYTLIIPEGSIHAYGQRYNPELRYTYTIAAAAEAVTVESISPEPYVEGGEYSEAIPSEITVTMTGEDFTVAEDGVIAYYGISGLGTPLDYTVSGTEIAITVPESLLGENNLIVAVTATDAGGNAITYGSDTRIEFRYVKANNTYSPETITPEDNSEVESLSEFRLHFTTVPMQYDNTTGVTLQDEAGKTVANGEMSWDPDMGIDIIITLDNVITTAGTYTLVIPERSFTPDFNFDVYNPELRYTYTVIGTNGISGININAGDTVKVYTVDGVYIGEGPASEVLGKLGKGLYIVNGKKVAVR